MTTGSGVNQSKQSDGGVQSFQGIRVVVAASVLQRFKFRNLTWCMARWCYTSRGFCGIRAIASSSNCKCSSDLSDTVLRKG